MSIGNGGLSKSWALLFPSPGRGGRQGGAAIAGARAVFRDRDSRTLPPRVRGIRTCLLPGHAPTPPRGVGCRSVRCRRTSGRGAGRGRSEEHTSELQSLMRISYAVFCLKKKNKHAQITPNENK